METAIAGERTALPSLGVLAGVLAALALGAFAAGCGGTDKTLDPLLSRVDQSRDVQALSALQQSVITATLVRTESGSYGTGPDDLAQRLQAKDPSKRFGTAPSTAPEQIQVLGGGAMPAMLVIRSTSGNFLAVWSDGNVTEYYRGVQSPALPAQRPAGGGWSEQPDTSRTGT